MLTTVLNNARKRVEEQKQKVRQKLQDPRSSTSCIACGISIVTTKSRQRKYCSLKCSHLMKMRDNERRSAVDSLWNLSSRTRSKIIERSGKGCCRCGWNEGSCDLHHIHGRKIADPHRNENLALLCPNCHRLYHEGKIGPDDVVSLDIYIGDWMKYYYG